MEVSLYHASKHRERCPPASGCPTQTRVLLWCRQPHDFFHTFPRMTLWGPTALHSVTKQLVWWHVQMWFMLYVIYVIRYLMCICVCTSYYCDLVVGLNTHFSTLLEVCGDCEVGCWPTVIDTKTSLYDEGTPSTTGAPGTDGLGTWLHTTYIPLNLHSYRWIHIHTTYTQKILLGRLPPQ